MGQGGGCLVAARLDPEKENIRLRGEEGGAGGGGGNIRLDIPGHPLCGCSPPMVEREGSRRNRFEKVETSLILRAIKQSVKGGGLGRLA